jgi:CBS domain-containing protein
MEVGHIMNREVDVCHPHDTLNRAAQIMWDRACGAVPVINENSHPVGFLTDRDICMAAYTQGKTLSELSVEGAMSRRLVGCKTDDTLEFAGKLMRENRVRRLVVTNPDGTLAGILALDDIACEASRTVRGGINRELRDLVLEVHLAIHRGHLRLNPPI